jgi:hypothetical protein
MIFILKSKIFESVKEFVVVSHLLQEFLMSTTLNNSTFFHNNYLIEVLK